MREAAANAVSFASAVVATVAVTVAVLTYQAVTYQASDMAQLTAGAGHGAVLITGGGGGIGRAVGEMLEAEG